MNWNMKDNYDFTKFSSELELYIQTTVSYRNRFVVNIFAHWQLEHTNIDQRKKKRKQVASSAKTMQYRLL